MSFPGQALQQAWHLVDAQGQTVGRLAATVAPLLKGKHKPTFRPNKDMGDHVVIINAGKVNFTGKKWKDKKYRWHTGYPGGLKERSAAEMRDRNPTQILRKAILGMIPRNKLRQSYMEPRLHLYVGPTHPHTAQLPPEKVEALPPVPRTLRGDTHFGLQHYAHPQSYQASVAPPPSHPEIQWTPLEDAMKEAIEQHKKDEEEES